MSPGFPDYSSCTVSFMKSTRPVSLPQMSQPAEMTPVQLVDMDSDDSLDGSPSNRHNAFSSKVPNGNDGYHPDNYRVGGQAPAVGFFVFLRFHQ